ncbi:MAG TPA: SpoIIE family protein phosphatase, partial [Candidatus Ozemobacteraceae bacterium]|nr:SpoIIE family protein phosphatase [Candidatus Ozemobacteraceae bacterium]
TFAVSLYPTARNFPRFDSYRPYFELLKRARRVRDNVLFHRDSEMAADSELAFLRCSHLKHYTLIKAVPHAQVPMRLSTPRSQVFGFMLGTLLFGVGLFHIFIQRLLVPVREITAAIEAMGRKNFEFRVPVHSGDEMGKLCQALNHALAHLGQMEVASAIQTALLPRAPYQAGCVFVAGRNQMTQAVGGDYFDLLPLADQRCAVILGDVSGHGVSAAMVAAMAKAGFSLLCPLHPEHPEVVLEKLNHHFLKILDRTKMMTCLIGVVHGASRKLIFSNAGQSYPLLIDSNGNTELYSFASTPLGVRGKAKFVARELDLTKVDIVFYSDGLVEAQTPQGRMVDYEGFARAAQQAYPGDVTAFLERLFLTIRAMTDPVPWSDDASSVLISTRHNSPPGNNRLPEVPD